MNGMLITPFEMVCIAFPWYSENSEFIPNRVVVLNYKFKNNEKTNNSCDCNDPRIISLRPKNSNQRCP